MNTHEYEVRAIEQERARESAALSRSRRAKAPVKGGTDAAVPAIRAQALRRLAAMATLPRLRRT